MTQELCRLEGINILRSTRGRCWVSTCLERSNLELIPCLLDAIRIEWTRPGSVIAYQSSLAPDFDILKSLRWFHCLCDLRVSQIGLSRIVVPVITVCCKNNSAGAREHPPLTGIFFKHVQLPLEYQSINCHLISTCNSLRGYQSQEYIRENILFFSGVEPPTGHKFKPWSAWPLVNSSPTSL